MIKNWNRTCYYLCLQFICVCCNQEFYDNQVKKVTPEVVRSANKSNVTLLSLKSAKDKRWICKNCSNYLTKNRIPPMSVTNGFSYPQQDPIFRTSSRISRLLVAPRIAFMKLISKPCGGQKGKVGGLVNVPSHVNELLAKLPRCLNDNHLFHVEFYRHCFRGAPYMKRITAIANAFTMAKIIVSKTSLQTT